MTQWQELISKYLSANRCILPDSLEDLIEKTIISNEEKTDELSRTAAIFELITCILTPSEDDEKAGDYRIVINECFIKLCSFLQGDFNIVKELVDEFLGELNELNNGLLTLRELPILVNLILKLSMKEDENGQIFVLCLIHQLSQHSIEKGRIISNVPCISELIVCYMPNFSLGSPIMTIINSILSTVSISSAALVSLFKPLITSNDSHSKYLSTISSLLDKQRSSFYHFNNSSISVSLEPKAPITSYTFQIWFKLNSLDYEETIFSINNKISLRIQTSKLVVYYKNIRIDTIESFQIQEKMLYHLVLVHTNRSVTFGSPKLKLYINAQYIQSLKCPYPIENTSEFSSRLIPSTVSLTIGSSVADFEVYNCFWAADALSLECLVLSYYLGESYSNTFQDFNLLKFLNYEGRSYFNLKLLSLSKSTEVSFDSENLKLTLDKDIVLFNLNPFFLNDIVVSNVDDKDLESLNDHVRSGDSNTVTYYQLQNISELFYSISPFPLLFKTIESSKDMDTLYQATETVFKIINSNWKLIEEFESMNGYNLLSTILKVKKAELKKNFSSTFLNMFLKYNGYNFSASYTSVIINPSFYDNILLDFQLWRIFSSKITPEEKKEIIELLRSLIEQITIFTHECINSSYNVLKLKKLKIVKRFLNYMSQNFFPMEISDTIRNCLLQLVKADLTPATIKSLSGFVIYSLSEDQSYYGFVVLNILAELFLDPLVSNNSHWRKLFGSMSIKWILLLLQTSEKNKNIVDLGLSFLIKTFTASPKSYELFIKRNGLQILLGCLRDVDIDEIEINILIKGSFGHYQHDMNFESLSESLNVKSLDQLLFPSLHYLILDLLEWTVLNDIFKQDDRSRIVHLLNFYLDFCRQGIDGITDFDASMKIDKNWLRRLCGLVIILTKPQNSTIYFNPSERILELLSGFIMSNLLKASSAEIEFYTSSLLTSTENDGKPTVISTVFLSLVVPKLLLHLKDFSSEFGMLLETGNISFINFAVFLNILNNQLLTFQWKIKDYFNYTNILLDLLESFRKNKKNTRNPQYTQLVKNVTQVINTLIVVLQAVDSAEQQENFIKLIMFHQENLFENNYLSNEGCANLICYLLEMTVTENHSVISSLTLNCLRIVLMQRQVDISAIASSITFMYYPSLSNFLNTSVTLGDEDLISTLISDPKLVLLLRSHLSSLLSKLNKKSTKSTITSVQNIMRNLSKVQESSVKHKYERLGELIKMLHNENQLLKSKILSNEGLYLSRFLQDQQDSLQFFISAYYKMKTDTRNEISVLFNLHQTEQRWTLDTTEGIDRMRKVLLPLNVLPTTDKITNMTDFPISRRLSGNDAENEMVGRDLLSLCSFEMVDAGTIQEDPTTVCNDKNRKVLKSLCTGDQIVEIWNVSQIIGLEIVEGILILGQSHIYLIENYYHNPDDDEIVDITEISESLRDPNVKLITGQPSHKPTGQSGADINSHIVQTWDLFELTSVTKRQFLLRDVALELFFSDGDSFLITSMQTRERDTIYSKLSNVATNSNIDDDLSKIFKETNAGNNSKLNTHTNSLTSRLANVFSSEFSLEATRKWQRGEISNFYYLMIINTLAGRTFNDLTQYPVFPWVIADYTSQELDLSDPKTFRDLSKPMGAQSAKRAQQFKDRYEALESIEDEESPPFHYGTHYSSAMIVVSFLIRLEPFVQSYLLLQGGKFDHADRLFYSIEKAWNSASAENTTDVRELIPEFFFLPEFLSNVNHFDFGKLQDGTCISGVDLPKWAKGDPNIFITKNREALESPYVSEHLHEWIDLVFGVRQSGPLAVESINVFNHLSYHGGIDLESINNEDERRSITGIIHNFGQTPLQIFSKPHPSRISEDGVEVNEFNLNLNANTLKKTPNMLYQTKFKSAIKFVQFKLHSDNIGDAFWRGYPELHLNGNFQVKPDDAETTGSLLINRQCFERLHDDTITTIALLSTDMFITGSQSGTIHIWKVLVSENFEQVNLNFLKSLRLHTSGIKELKVSPEYNLLLSMDYDGNVFLWNLASYSFIRSIDIKADHVSISYESGLIATSKGSIVNIYTINGQKIIGHETSVIITSLGFGNSKTVTSFKSPSFPIRHEFWKDHTILTIGTNIGIIKIYSLNIDGSWILKPLETLEFADKINQFERKEITVVECYLKSYIDSNYEKKSKMDVIAGDCNGRVAVWR